MITTRVSGRRNGFAWRPYRAKSISQLGCDIGNSFEKRAIFDPISSFLQSCVSVVIAAREHGDPIVTSDPDDLRHLDPAAAIHRI